MAFVFGSGHNQREYNRQAKEHFALIRKSKMSKRTEEKAKHNQRILSNSIRNSFFKKIIHDLDEVIGKTTNDIIRRDLIKIYYNIVTEHKKMKQNLLSKMPQNVHHLLMNHLYRNDFYQNSALRSTSRSLRNSGKNLKRRFGSKLLL